MATFDCSDHRAIKELKKEIRVLKESSQHADNVCSFTHHQKHVLHKGYRLSGISETSPLTLLTQLPSLALDFFHHQAVPPVTNLRDLSHLRDHPSYLFLLEAKLVANIKELIECAQALLFLATYYPDSEKETHHCICNVFEAIKNIKITDFIASFPGVTDSIRTLLFTTCFVRTIEELGKLSQQYPGLCTVVKESKEIAYFDGLLALSSLFVEYILLHSPL